MEEAEKELNTEGQKELLEIARRAVEYCLDKKEIEIKSDLEELKHKRGVFVTIHKHGKLRGCIGVFTSDKPLYKAVAEMALCAAFKDPRFPAITSNEMKDIDFEISVLSPLKEVRDIGEIEIGTHGIYITKGLFRGVLLPQVATEYGWDVETFLAHTCLKAGLSKDAWRQGAKIEIFSTQIIEEKDFKGDRL